MKEFKYRSVEDIMEEIRSRAEAYTPEWHFNSADPDIGTALAEIYAGIQNGLDRKYMLMSDKLKIDYFNCLNTSMKAAEVAEGYTVFEISDENMDGEILQAGTQLRSNITDQNGDAVPVELSEDICVVPDTLETIYETNGRKDYIGLLYEQNEETTSSFPLFGMSSQNLERHVFFLSHPWMFRYSRYGNIILKFLDEDGHMLSDNQLARFQDSTSVRFFCDNGSDTNCDLTDVTVRDGCIFLKVPDDLDAWVMTEHNGISSYWLGCEVLDLRGLESFAPFRVLLGAECPVARMDNIYSAATDQPLDEAIFAFGEQFSLYDDIYFGSEDTLSKKSAEIEISFEEEFAKIPIVTREGSAFNWKLIIPKDQFRQEEDYDITIEEVIWEYFNGVGWSRLFKSNEYRDIFTPVRGLNRQVKKIRFICPDDLEPVMAGSSINYYIRARILKINNAFKTRGQYLSPVLSDIRISCRLDPRDNEPDFFYAINHLEDKFGSPRAYRNAGKRLTLIDAGGDSNPAMYFGFTQPPTRGPVRMLWETTRILEKNSSTILWEYYKNGVWNSLHPADETEGFRMTGTVTFSGIPDAEHIRLFGRDLYWIRAVRRTGNKNIREIPEIRGFYLNAAKVVTLRHGLEEFLTMENYQEGMQFQLLNSNIHDLELWVREDERIDPKEAEELKSEGSYREILNENGDRNTAWIRWKQTDHLRRHGPSDRVYMLDEIHGVITFGGGKCGRLPTPGINEGIYVSYSIGGGKIDCLPENAIIGLELTGGLIRSVRNPMPLYGAYDRESTQMATQRAAAEYRTQLRAVTQRDFEELALGRMGNLRKARCYSCIDQRGQKSPGAVTLVLLTDDYMDRGAGFENIRRSLYEWFDDKISANLSCGGNFRIREAELVAISVQIEAIIDDYQHLYRIQKFLDERLEEFFHPIYGNLDGEGWDIGSLPERFQIETLIRSVEGIRELRRCLILANLPKQTGTPTVDFDEIHSADFVVPINGKHYYRLTLSD